MHLVQSALEQHLAVSNFHFPEGDGEIPEWYCHNTLCFCACVWRYDLDPDKRNLWSGSLKMQSQIRIPHTQRKVSFWFIFSMTTFRNEVKAKRNVPFSFQENPGACKLIRCKVPLRAHCKRMYCTVKQFSFCLRSLIFKFYHSIGARAKVYLPSQACCR